MTTTKRVTTTITKKTKITTKITKRSSRSTTASSDAITTTKITRPSGICSLKQPAEEHSGGVQHSEYEVEPGGALDDGVETLRRRGRRDVSPEPDGGGGAEEDDGALQRDDTQGHQRRDSDVG